MLEVLPPPEQEPDPAAAAVALRFRLVPVLATEQFPPARLAPGRNNVRAHGSGADLAQQLPTPAYNSAILQASALQAGPCLHRGRQR